MVTEEAFVDLRDLDINTGGRDLVISLTIFMFFDFIFIGIRFYARHVKRRFLEINDWAILVGFIILIVIYALQIVQVVYAGLGIDALWIIQYLGPDRFRFIMKCVFASNILWNICIMAIRISILHLYFTIFNSVTTMKRLVLATLAFTIIGHTAIIIELFLLCKPLAYFWDQGLSIQGKCPDHIGGQMAKLIPGLISVILDVIIFALPIPVLWTLRMPLTKKFLTSAVFGVGFGIVIVSAVRLSYIFQPNSDIKYAITGAVEPMVGIMVSCTPMVQPVVEHLSRGRIVLWATSKRSQPKSGSNMSSWPQQSYKDYVLSGKSGGTRTIEDIEEGDVPLIEMGRVGTKDRGVMHMREEDGEGRSGAAEEGRIRMTRDFIVQNTPKDTHLR